MTDRPGFIFVCSSRTVSQAIFDASLAGTGVPGRLDRAGAESGGTPSASAARALDGDGEPTVGDATLTFSGEFDLSDDAVAFDGVSGFGSTPGAGPVVTTESFSVAAWVNLARPADYPGGGESAR